MKSHWHVSIAIDGRDKGAWNHECVQPWTAIYWALRYGVAGWRNSKEDKTIYNEGLRDTTELVIRVRKQQKDGTR